MLHPLAHTTPHNRLMMLKRAMYAIVPHWGIERGGKGRGCEGVEGRRQSDRKRSNLCVMGGPLCVNWDSRDARGVLSVPLERWIGPRGQGAGVWLLFTFWSSFGCLLGPAAVSLAPLGCEHTKSPAFQTTSSSTFSNPSVKRCA